MDANAALATAWGFVEDNGWYILAAVVLLLLVRSKVDRWRDERHTRAVMARATDPELHKDEREEMRKARERMQAKYAEVAAQSADELEAKRRERAALQAKEARLRKRRTDFGAGGPLGSGGSGGGPARIIGGPSARYGRRGGG